MRYITEENQPFFEQNESAMAVLEAIQEKNLPFKVIDLIRGRVAVDEVAVIIKPELGDAERQLAVIELGQRATAEMIIEVYQEEARL